MTTPIRPFAAPGAPVPPSAIRGADGCSFALHGRVDVTALRAAYAALLEEYPAFAARMIAERDRFRFAPGDPAVAAAIGFRDAAAPWGGFTQAPPEFVGSEQLSALSLTGIGDESRLTLWIGRVAAAPVGVIAPAARLFEFYAALAGGARPLVHRPTGARTFGLPTEPQRLAAAAGREPRERGRTRADDARRVRFDAAETAGLIDCARARAIPLIDLIDELIGRADAPAGRIDDLGTVPVPAVPAGIAVLDFHSQRSDPAQHAVSYVLSVFAGRLSVELRGRPETPGGPLDPILQRVVQEARHLLTVGAAA
ncbi:hypothetical protein [Tsukamurella sp. PLM1]|uniref:hypothetical protein n=1 Tax=Tsukamurella sp. PLM1 TaxID=2929795 RepID=UPI0020525435|nr:hypothetical protein [Tsukamurella sp. PLM1]BDH58735.1 hypothetical protein MTP03_36740 [Tsukamurella sp. PLM1]